MHSYIVNFLVAAFYFYDFDFLSLKNEYLVLYSPLQIDHELFDPGLSSELEME